jgi:hypothetical protein
MKTIYPISRLLPDKHTSYSPGLFVAFLLFAFSTMTSCDDIIEKDLSGKKVALVAPGDSLQTDINSQTFYWEEMNGTLSYNLQIVSPSFNRIEQFVLDTNISTHSFEINLTPGAYEWRVRAANGSSKSDYALRSLQIFATNDVTKQKVQLTNPSDAKATNLTSLVFDWQILYNATDYIFQIWEPDLNGTKIKDTLISSSSLSINWTWPNGSYIWGVKAYNNISNTYTQFTARSIMVDTIPPSVISSIDSPRKDSTINSWPITLKWSRKDTDGGSKLYDSVYVSADSSFSSNVYKYKSYNKNQSISLSSNGKYYWKIKTSDEAGNSSKWMSSSSYRFIKL